MFYFISLITNLKNIVSCYHCGDLCESELIEFDNHSFCCNGCKTVYEILNQNDLANYYSIENTPGIKNNKLNQNYYKFLELPEITNKLYGFNEDNKKIIRLFLPDIHCSSCIWLLENLHKLNGAIIFSEVNFLNKEALISFDSDKISLKELAELLHKIGYEPKFDSEPSKKLKDKSIYYK